MDPNILYYGSLVLAVMAGAGLMATVELFRLARAPQPVSPLTRAAEAIADALGPVAAPPSAPPARTRHHEYDTMDVYRDGYETGQRHHTSGYGWPPPWPTDDSKGIVSGPGPDLPLPPPPHPLDTSQPWPEPYPMP